MLKVIAMFVLLSSPAYAMSVAYQGSFGLMSSNQPKMGQWILNYSVTPWLAPAAQAFRLETSSGHRELYFPQVGVLAHRWNNTDSQANIYLDAGYGADKMHDRTTGALNTEAQIDWESRRYYGDVELQAVRLTRNEPYNFGRFRVGAAPYLAEFDQLQSWFILQFERNSAMSSETTVTPLIRMFYQNVLVEIGSSLKGEFNFNFMIHI